MATASGSMPSRQLFASRGDSAAAEGDAARVAVPTDLCYGMRVGIRSCVDQRYVAVFRRQGSAASMKVESLDLEVSGFHPFRHSDVADRTADCPSEWVVLQHSWQQHSGPIHVGDDVCFVKELVATGENRKDRHLLYLALGPAVGGDSMEPVVERLEACTDVCKWTLLHAENPDFSGKLTAETPLVIRSKYREFLAIGRPLWEASMSGTGNFRSPARTTGKSLVCRAGDRVAGHGGASGGGSMRLSPEMHFRLVRAGVSFHPESVPVARAALAALLPSEAAAMEDFGRLEVQAQEQTFLEDLLFCLMGFEGSHIRRVAQPPDAGAAIPEVQFEVNAPPGADISIVQFLQLVLPLCEHHVAVQKFVEVHSQYEYGTVNHALCAAIRELLREFSIKIGQLETALRMGNLTIAKLWYHLQPSMDTLTLLHRIASHVFHAIGGQVLNGIEEVMSRSSLTTAQDLCEHLLQQSSRPYFEMVSKWVYEGCLDDPYNEFFISENPRARDEKTGGPAADFWQKHFALEEHSVPQFLKESREKILHAGKYLHVFYSASPNAQLPREDENRRLLRYSRRRKDCMQAIDAAYRRSSAALLGVFMSPRPDGLDLPGRLRSMRCFFFLSKADWFGQFMDAAVEELEQNATEIPITRLEGLLDLAIRTSSVASDSYRDDISCSTHSFKIEDACKRISKGQSLPSEEPEDNVQVRPATSGTPGHGLSKIPAQAVAADADGLTQNSGVRCFTLKYRTSWPVSIIFSKGLILKYQVIFRHLLFCRHVERKLVDLWVEHQSTKDLGIDSNLTTYYSLRQRMLHFCRDYIYYATAEVLEPQSHRFFASLEQAETIDEVIKNHEKFLDACLRELLLTGREGLYLLLSKTLNTCYTFAYNVHHALHRFTGPRVDEHRNVSHAEGSTTRESRAERQRERQAMYSDFVMQRNQTAMLSKFKKLFEGQMHKFLRHIRQETTHNYEQFLSNMLTRLDYNDFYSVLEGMGSASPPADSDAVRT